MKNNVLIGGGLTVLLFFIGCGSEAEECFNNDPEIPDGIILNCEFEVDYLVYGDFNNDGNEDVGIYLWKKGNYGEAMPFWEEENDDSYKQHLFLYEKDKEGKWKSLWHSSNLPYINIKTELRDIDEDNENELIVLEKMYDTRGEYGDYQAVWKWDEWGFKNIRRSEKGRYYDLNLNGF